MPKASELFRIAIHLYFRGHAPPHLHAIYAGHEAQVAIEDSRVIEGRLPPRAIGLVVEWATLHRAELLRAWERAAIHEAPGAIAPLE
jgi:hypothetical protein